MVANLQKENNYDKASARLSSAVDALSESDINLIDSYNDKFSSATLEEKANIIARLAMIKSVREELFSQNENLSEVRKASNEFKKSSAGQLAESPRNGSERRFIRSVFKSVEQNLLAEYGVSINQADLQAVIWYPEKALYKKMKESVSKNEMNIDTNEQPDYETAAGKLARGKYGISDDQINQAVRSAGATARAAANRGSFARRFGELGEYNTSSTQPSVNSLQPIPDNTNPNRVQIGNPELKPTFSHRLGMNYNSWNAVTNRNIWSGANFNYTNNGFPSFNLFKKINQLLFGYVS